MVAGEATSQSEDCLANVPQEQSKWVVEAAGTFTVAFRLHPKERGARGSGRGDNTEVRHFLPVFSVYCGVGLETVDLANHLFFLPQCYLL